MAKKLCRQCNRTQPVEQFPVQRINGKDYRSSPCRTCRNLTTRQRREQHPDWFRTAQQQWREKPGTAEREADYRTRKRRETFARTLSEIGK